MTVLNFIDQNFQNSVLENKTDEGNRFGLPFPYTVPSPGDVFDCMFYWDTHFTNVGLITSGRIQQAIYNTDNIKHMIERFGYMPNGTKQHFLGQSQPPVYYRMVADIFQVTKDLSWLSAHYDSIAREYEFWMTQRLAPNGLNYYGNIRNDYTDKEIQENFLYCQSRFSNFDTDVLSEKMDAIHTVKTLCESGWDCCYRFEIQGSNYNPVDLNALLYGLESTMSQFSNLLQKGEDAIWAERALQRKVKMDRWMWSEEKGFYLDWNFKTEKHSPMVSAASLFPLYLGITHDPEKIITVLEKELLLPYGVTCTEKPTHSYALQWEYPNIWAPLQYVAYMACRNAGRQDLAREIAKRYLGLLDENFAATGKLWEKYDGNTGKVVNAEYNAPPMLGWTAGVYLAFLGE